MCACDTRDRGVNKKLKPEHPSETVVMPESGERKRNLTTLVLVKNAAVKVSCTCSCVFYNGFLFMKYILAQEDIHLK